MGSHSSRHSPISGDSMDCRVNWTPPTTLPCSSRQACLDEGMALIEGLSSSSQRQKFTEDVLLNDIFEKLFVFGGGFQEFLQHENPLQKQVTSFHIHNAEYEMFVWLMIIEALLERLYQRLRFLSYRLAVYTMACFWSYSEFPGRIRPPCTTMPWTIWPALVVLWGVCWMFYPSPDKTFDRTSLDSQPHLEYQLQPEALDDGLLWLDLTEVHPISESFGDPSFSDEWWNHDAEACPPTSIRQSGPTTTFDPDRSTTNPSNSGSTSQHDLVPGLRGQSESQWDRPGMDDVTNHIAAVASEPTATNRLKCPDCDKILSRHDSLRRHQQTQHNREVEEHLCPYKACKRSRQGSGFSRPDGLRRHLKACKLRRKRALTVASEAVDSQTDSGNGTGEDSQARSSSHDTSSTQGPNGVGSQQPPADSWEEELRKRYEEAKVVYERKKREFEEAQRVMDSYETLIENEEKGHAA